jgi:hypothetical protein
VYAGVALCLVILVMAAFMVVGVLNVQFAMTSAIELPHLSVVVVAGVIDTL